MLNQPTKKLRIALAQQDFWVGAISKNTQQILNSIQHAKTQGADLVVFPEMALSGYSAQDLWLRTDLLEQCNAALETIRLACSDITAVVGAPLSEQGVLYNAGYVFQNQTLINLHKKNQLPNYGVFDDARYFHPGESLPCIVNIAGIAVGILICEDIWWQTPLDSYKTAGAELVVIANASPFEHDKITQRQNVLQQRVKETGLPLAYLNMVGGQDNVVFDGNSLLVDGDGGLHPAAEAFSDQILITDYCIETQKFQLIEWQSSVEDQNPQSRIWRALVRGTADYARKNGFSKAWLGLSGGLDSGLVVAIAAEALGAENVTAVRLPSRYTAGLSNDLAQQQCDELGITLHTVSIEAPFKGFLETLQPMFADTTVDVTEENLQSRCRGALMMALTNKFGGLLLTTGNKSEYAVGYATIYGDMCGGYAPLNDIYKTEAFALARWRNQSAGREIIPNAVIERPPSAELRDNQTDQDSLPEYAILDAILRRFIEEKQSYQTIVDAGFSPETVKKIIHLIKISEWKRHQAAPGPKITALSFSNDRRYPITNGFLAI